MSDHLAATDNGGKSWYLVGAAFPFDNGPLGYSQVEFMTLEDGYAFGPAGLAVTHDAGRHWTEAVGLTGALQRVVPIGNDVWATEITCNGPPVATTSCSVELAISTDAGLIWQQVPGAMPLSEARSGGDILARLTTTAAYVVSYGPTGGGLVLTTDAGRRWTRLPDPCEHWQRVDVATPSDTDLWMICGGPPVLAGTASSKAVFRSYDGGKQWSLVASTGFGPPFGPGALHAPTGPVGSIAYAGQLSQLATISASRAWIGVSGVGVLVSFDYGRDWTLASGIEDDGHDTGVGVTFNDAVHGWAIEFHQGVFKTDNGLQWTLVDGT